jgi:hypothetical protein
MDHGVIGHILLMICFKLPFFFVQPLGVEFCCGKEHFIHYCNNPIGDGICFMTHELPQR